MTENSFEVIADNLVRNYCNSKLEESESLENLRGDILINLSKAEELGFDKGVLDISSNIDTLIDDKRKLRNDLYKRALDLWGLDAQREMVYEEIGEFLDAFAKMKRNRATYRDVSQEIADVKIMLEQVEVGYQLQDRVQYEIALKISRLSERVRKAEKKQIDDNNHTHEFTEWIHVGTYDKISGDVKEYERKCKNCSEVQVYTDEIEGEV